MKTRGNRVDPGCGGMPGSRVSTPPLSALACSRAWLDPALEVKKVRNPEPKVTREEQARASQSYAATGQCSAYRSSGVGSLWGIAGWLGNACARLGIRVGAGEGRISRFELDSTCPIVIMAAETPCLVGRDPTRPSRIGSSVTDGMQGEAGR